MSISPERGTDNDMPPQWFLAALEHQAQSFYADACGTPVHYLCWNPEDADKPALIFAHGYRGHAHWWDFIAPFFTENFRVCALDFSGMGDSGRRTVYDAEIFTEDLVAVIRAVSPGPATLIGHSYGGTRVLRACADYPALIRHAIILDSYINFPATDVKYTPRQYGSPLPFPDRNAAIARYRLLPEQPAEPWARKHIAEYSITPVDGGWNWKFDRNLPFAIFETDGPALLAHIETPVDIVTGECSVVVSPERAHRIIAGLTNSQRARGPIMMPNAHHHLMLDQPLALVSALRALLS